MDIKNGKTLLIAVAIVVFGMIYTIGVVWDFFPPPDAIYDHYFGDTRL